MTEKQLQQKMMEYQIMEEKLKQLGQQRELFIAKMMEIEQTKQAVEEMKKSEKADILVPLGSGLFLPGKINKKEKMLVGIGADIVIEKSKEKVNKIIEERKKTIELGLENVQKNMLQIAQKMQLIQTEAQNLMPKKQAG